MSIDRPLPVRGVCDAHFVPVRDALAANLEEEIGAAVVVQVGGKVVVDLCGGWADAGRTRPWTYDTVVDVFSCGKGFVALTVLSLGLDLDVPVWQDATLRQVLAHQAGHPALRVEVPPEAIYDWDWMVQALESQEPWWVPGSAHGYHVNTFGFICGEIVRRTTGEPLRSRFARLAGDAAGVTFGAPPGADVAEFVFDIATGASADVAAGISDARRQLLARVYLNPPGLSGLGTVNSAAWRAAEIPSANCHASARGIAAVYARMPELLGSDVLAERRRDHGPTALTSFSTATRALASASSSLSPTGRSQQGSGPTVTSARAARLASTTLMPTLSSPTYATAARVAAGRPHATAGCSMP